MIFLMASKERLTFGESMQIFLLGFSIVFFVLISLSLLIRVLKLISERSAAASAAESGQTTPGTLYTGACTTTSGEAYLYTAGDAACALIMAIIAEESEIPLPNLRITSIKLKTQEKDQDDDISLNVNYSYKSERFDDMNYDITLNNKVYSVKVEKGEAVLLIAENEVSAAQGAPAQLAAEVPAQPAAAPSNGTVVVSPLPGTVIAIKVSAGDSVNKGQVLAVIEAMKMENEIPAPVSGKIASINIQSGASVNSDTPLFVIS